MECQRAVVDWGAGKAKWGSFTGNKTPASRYMPYKEAVLQAWNVGLAPDEKITS